MTTRGLRRGIGSLVAAVVVVACSSSAASSPRTTTAPPASTVSTPSSTTTSISTTTALASTTTGLTSTTALTTTSASTASPGSTVSTTLVPPSPGADGVGDPLYPHAGNGGYDVQSYDLSLTWHPSAGSIDATAVITAVATQGLSRFNLDFTTLPIDSLTVEGVAAGYLRSDLELLVVPVAPIADGATFTTTVAYHGVPTIDRTGGWFRDPKGGVIVFGEPEGAAGWYPVDDHPLDKATYTIHVTAPSSLGVASNGDLVGTDAAAGETTWTFDERYPQASYLTTLAIGDYVTVDGGTTARGTPIRNVFPRHRVTELTKAFADQAKMIDAFEQWFGPYPFDVYGALVVDDFDPGGALEAQTLSIFGSGSAGGTVIPHELAHQWFGDSVSLERWQDIWLNEGFATYAERLWEEAQDPSVDLTAEIRDEITGQSPAGAALLDQPLTDVDGTQAGLFTTSVYQRGGYLLHALRMKIGDDAFRALLHRWTADHAYANATTADFVALADEVSGQRLDDWFDRWLNANPMPDDLGALPAAASG